MKLVGFILKKGRNTAMYKKLILYIISVNEIIFSNWMYLLLYITTKHSIIARSSIFHLRIRCKQNIKRLTDGSKHSLIITWSMEIELVWPIFFWSNKLKHQYNAHLSLRNINKPVSEYFGCFPKVMVKKKKSCYYRLAKSQRVLAQLSKYIFWY